MCPAPLLTYGTVSYVVGATELRSPPAAGSGGGRPPLTTSSHPPRPPISPRQQPPAQSETAQRQTSRAQDILRTFLPSDLRRRVEAMDAAADGSATSAASLLSASSDIASLASPKARPTPHEARLTRVQSRNRQTAARNNRRGRSSGGSRSAHASSDSADRTDPKRETEVRLEANNATDVRKTTTTRTHAQSLSRSPLETAAASKAAMRVPPSASTGRGGGDGSDVGGGDGGTSAKLDTAAISACFRDAVNQALHARTPNADILLDGEGSFGAPHATLPGNVGPTVAVRFAINSLDETSRLALISALISQHPLVQQREMGSEEGQEERKRHDGGDGVLSYMVVGLAMVVLHNKRELVADIATTSTADEVARAFRATTFKGLPNPLGDVRCALTPVYPTVDVRVCILSLFLCSFFLTVSASFPLTDFFHSTSPAALCNNVNHFQNNCSRSQFLWPLLPHLSTAHQQVVLAPPSASERAKLATLASTWYHGSGSDPASRAVSHGELPQTTVSLLPAATFVRSGLVLNVLRRASEEQFDLVGLRLVYADTEDLRRSGGEHVLLSCSSPPQRPAYVSTPLEGRFPVLVIALRRPAAIATWCAVVGPEDPVIARKTDPCSLRALYGTTRGDTLLSYSRSPAQAHTHLACWFGRRFTPPQSDVTVTKQCANGPSVGTVADASPGSVNDVNTLFGAPCVHLLATNQVETVAIIVDPREVLHHLGQWWSFIAGAGFAIKGFGR